MVHCGIFMLPPLGAGGIMFSGCPSVRPSVQSPKYLLSTCTWVRWSVRPTVTVLRHVRPSVCPSVRPERFPGICRRTHGGSGLKFCMLMYRDPLQNWLDYGHGLLIFLFLAPLWLSEMGEIWGFPGITGRTHGGNGLKMCMPMYHDHLQNWLVYGYGLLIFLILALFWLSKTGQICGFRAFTGERIKGMAWNFVC